MNTSELELPRHLYSETEKPDGTGYKVTFTAEKLIAWSEDGYGDAIDKWCKQIFDRKIEAIDAWEEHRFLQLEEEWLSVENDEDDDEAEEHYHLACDAVAREADIKRDAAMERMAEHKAAIERLVQESKDFIASDETPPEEEHILGYLIGLAAVAAVAYAAVA